MKHNKDFFVYNIGKCKMTCIISRLEKVERYLVSLDNYSIYIEEYLDDKYTLSSLYDKKTTEYILNKEKITDYNDIFEKIEKKVENNWEN